MNLQSKFQTKIILSLKINILRVCNINAQGKQCVDF